MNPLNSWGIVELGIALLFLVFSFIAATKKDKTYQMEGSAATLFLIAALMGCGAFLKDWPDAIVGIGALVLCVFYLLNSITEGGMAKYFNAEQTWLTVTVAFVIFAAGPVLAFKAPSVPIWACGLVSVVGAALGWFVKKISLQKNAAPHVSTTAS